MTFAIAAAGTGGHVFPGLSVGQALVERGVPRSEILYIGGSRLEASVYPDAGFPFLSVELRGLKRSLSLLNLGIPRVVVRAVTAMNSEMRSRRVGVVLGMGGYVTIPAAIAARRAGCRLAISEQNAEAGLANTIAGRWADATFGAFPSTRRLRDAWWVGNPMRRDLVDFNRLDLRREALDRYGLDPTTPVVGVLGGSLGAGVLNDAVRDMVQHWDGPPIQLLHLAGVDHAPVVRAWAEGSAVPWVVVGFEDSMEWFYAAADLVVARAGGAVAELAVTGTPSILVPGGFGSGHHQQMNARAFVDAGGAVALSENEIDRLASLVRSLVEDPDKLTVMAADVLSLAKPDAADVIAQALEELHG